MRKLFCSVKACLLTGCLILSIVGNGSGQVPPSADAQALLQEAKSRELERQREAKVRDLQRMNEDLEKDQREAEALKQSADKVASAAVESTNRITQIITQKKQFGKMQEIAGLQIEAETLKAEGLKLLSEAQARGVATLQARGDVTDIRSALEKLKLNPPGGKPLTPKEISAAEQVSTKKLERAERAAFTARSIAREAMAMATAKLQAADDADEKVRARAEELGLPIAKASTPSQENVEPLKDIDPAAPAAEAESAPEAGNVSPVPASSPSEIAPSASPQVPEPEYPRALPVHPEKLPKP